MVAAGATAVQPRGVASGTANAFDDVGATAVHVRGRTGVLASPVSVPAIVFQAIDGATIPLSLEAEGIFACQMSVVGCSGCAPLSGVARVVAAHVSVAGTGTPPLVAAGCTAAQLAESPV